MDVHLSSLRTFLIVARYRGISRALGEVHLTQPAVTRQIQGLEQYLGTSLFLRKGRFLHLTEAGHILEHYAARVFQHLKEAQEEIDNLKGLVRGHIRLAASTTIGTYMIPDVLGEFKTRHPGIEIALDIANKEEVLRQVQAGTVDLGFVGSPVPFPEFARDFYLEDDMVLITSPQHHLATSNTVTSKLFAEEMFIHREMGSGTRETVEEELRQAGATLLNTMELGSTEAIKKAVAANLGISIVSTRAVFLEVMIGNLAAVRVSDMDLRHRVYMVHLPKVPLSSAAEGFRRFLSEHHENTGETDDLPAPTGNRGGDGPADI